MHLPQIFLFLITFFTTIHAFTIPSLLEDVSSASQDLFKRKGGGGGSGGSKGGGGGTSSGGSSSSGSSSGSSGSSSGSSGGRTGSGSTGSTGSTGSSGTRGYGGGGYYGGGATTPYRAGGVRNGITPILFAGAGIGLFAGYAAGAYVYSYDRPWTYYNETSNQNETHPVDCACGQNDECGCDSTNRDQDYINSVANDPTISNLTDVNGTQTLIINGTVDPNADSSSGTTLPGAGAHLVMSSTGWVAIVGGVAFSLLLM